MNHAPDQCQEYGCGALLLDAEERQEGLCWHHILIREWAAGRDFTAAQYIQRRHERQQSARYEGEA